MNDNQINDGGPAWPQSVSIAQPSGKYTVVHSQPGMSLRDWFAGQAMASLATIYVESETTVRGDDERWLNELAQQVDETSVANGDVEGCGETLATLAYRFADAMIAARSAEPHP